MRRIICTSLRCRTLWVARGPRWKECVADGCRRHRDWHAGEDEHGTSGLFLTSSGVGVAGNIDVQEANALTTAST